MQAVDPIFVSPRLIARDWGRTDLGEWARGPRGAHELIAEARVLDPANMSEAGPLGRVLARLTRSVLGDLGRAPPQLRLVFPGDPVSVQSTSPVSFWTIIEPGERQDGAHHRAGERIRAYEGAKVALAPGCVALEVSSSFQPDNEGEPLPQTIRLPPVSARTRATLFRETGLSVEAWMLPEWSRISPDGQTCHVLFALDDAIRLDGRVLRRGEAVLVPACGRPLDLATSLRGARLLVAYPDKAPTDVWRHAPGPDPAAGQLPRPEPARPPLEAVAAVSRAGLAA